MHAPQQSASDAKHLAGELFSWRRVYQRPASSVQRPASSVHANAISLTEMHALHWHTERKPDNPVPKTLALSRHFHLVSFCVGIEIEIVIVFWGVIGWMRREYSVVNYVCRLQYEFNMERLATSPQRWLNNHDIPQFNVQK